jgi:predicted ATPase
VCVRYRFSHALYQTVLYDKIVSARRAQLHLRAAEALVRHFGEGSPLVAVTLARHFEIGADVHRAVQYLAVAATRAHQLLADREAREHFSRAIALIAGLPPAARATAALPLQVGPGCVDFNACIEPVHVSSLTD